jgi:hypothetical protein
MNTGLLEHGFRIFSLLKIKEDSQRVHVELPCRTLGVWTANARHSKTPALLRIISNPYCFRPKSWTALTSVAQTVDFRCLQRSKCKVLQSQEQAGHAVGPPRVTHVPETRSSRIPKQWEENVAEHHHAWTISESQSADRHLATALEGSYVGNCGKQPQSDWWEKGRYQKSVSCISCMERQGGHWGFSLVIGRP